jgi:fructose transport system permease protein
MNKAKPRERARSQRAARLRRSLEQGLAVPGAGSLLALVAASAFFALETKQFLTGHNLSLIVQQVTVIGVEAIGQTLVILTAGIDLSNGNVMALGGVIMTGLAVDMALPPALAVLAGLLVTTAFGLLNGTLVTRIRLPAFIVTLGTLNIARALTLIYTIQTIANLPPFMLMLGNTFKVAQTEITYGSIIMIVLYLIMWYALGQTAWGRHVYAIGDNAEATRLAGISPARLLISVYTLAGLFYGIAALLLVARTGVGDPQAGLTDNLDSITAVVLGGTSLFGGRGSILGTLVGVLIVGVFRNGLQLMGVPSIYQVLVTGILVILSVSVDQLSHRGQE